MTAAGSAVVDGRGARRGRRGHPWIFRDNVLSVDARPGDLVRVADRDGDFVCWSAYSSPSKIALRRVSRQADPPDAAFWSGRLERALALRGALPANGCVRLLHADADGFPGLTIDWYAGHLVAQATTAWADIDAAGLVRELIARVGAQSVLARNDPAVRELEGLERVVEVLSGAPPEEQVAEMSGVERYVDLRRGHKTGLYLDQQLNQSLAPGWMEGEILDLFCGEGGFSLPLAAAGARVTAIDQAEAGLERGRRAAERRELSGSIEWIAGNAFDLLASFVRDGRVFDGLIVDPPPFARHRRSVRNATKAYTDLHRRAFQLIRPGGRLVSFCCSHGVDATSFVTAARAGAEDARVSARILERLGPAPDHPERLELPESRYLSGVLMEIDEGHRTRHV